MNMSFLFDLILYIPVNNVSGMSGPLATSKDVSIQQFWDSSLK